MASLLNAVALVDAASAFGLCQLLQMLLVYLRRCDMFS